MYNVYYNTNDWGNTTVKKFISTFFVVVMLSFLSQPVLAEKNENMCQHVWSSWEVLVEPTCGENGIQERHCLNCYETEYADIPATGDHEWDDWYTIKAATIFKTGLKERECSICGETQIKEIPKLKPYIKLSKKNIRLQEKKNYTLKIRYAKGDSIKKCKTSNKKVATVSKKGKIKAIKQGTAKITVILKSGKSATCKIEISEKKKVTSVNKATTTGTVYWTPGGSVYHKTRNCVTLKRSRTIYSGSRSSCPKSRACKVCYH